MYAAVDQQGRLVNAAQLLDLTAAERARASFCCPRCQRAVQWVTGPKTRPFFRHVPLQVGVGMESALHHSGKQTLQQALAKLAITSQLEVSLPFAADSSKLDEQVVARPTEPLLSDQGEQRRADVLWRSNERVYVLEFQCAPLTLATLRQRQRDYQRWGIQAVWLLGTTYFEHGILKNGALKFMSYQPIWGYYLAFWLPAAGCVQLLAHCLWQPPQAKLNYQCFSMSLATFLKRALVPRQAPSYLPAITARFDPRCWLQEQLTWQQPRWLAYQGRCYQAGWPLQQLPPALWLPQYLPPVVAHWPDLLARQLDFYLAQGALSEKQQRQLLAQSHWPLLLEQRHR
ncbi:competence protein CoiA [Lapidilactobacillus luobeiensis]|uniref:competence protein CoiA n=1 Tax=Lapidilactobacillus luobeiensis TaxID=2950371 RepID=UPI0021C42A34|nr:competence protein CoiA family protein [Lapidilactobacillus luobeiensis]